MLVQTWLEAEKALYGFNEREARDTLNKTLGTKYRHGNVNWWKQGRVPRIEVRLYMLKRTLRWYLNDELPKLDIDSESDFERIVYQLL